MTSRIDRKLFSWVCRLPLLLLSLAVGLARADKSPEVTLSNGNVIPIVGFGTHFRTATEEEAALSSALDLGYRHLDTAYVYGNEKTIAKALNKWFARGGKREELFLTTKLPPQAMRRDDVQVYLKKSLKNLGLDYVDAYLIHMPFGYKPCDKEGMVVLESGTCEVDPTTNHLAIWEAMEEQVKAGRVKSLGLSNFNASQVMNIYDNALVKPTLLQLELNLYLQQQGLLTLCKELNIRAIAYSPLGSNDLTRLRRRRSIDTRDAADDATTLPPAVEHPIVAEIAKKHAKTPAQILLRFSVEQDALVIPKSGDPKRQADNLNVFDFSLTGDDLARLVALDRHGKVRKFDFLTIDGVGSHPEYPFTDRVK